MQWARSESLIRDGVGKAIHYIIHPEVLIDLLL